MGMTHRQRDHEDEDLLDTLPIVGRATTQLERSFGPSCLLSLVIVLLLVVIFKRYLNIGWLGFSVLTLIVWFLVLTLLVRWRPYFVEDDE